MKGIFLDIKRFAVHDGPGIRTTIFLKGCPLRCLWCHNPESISGKPEIGFLKKKCTGCQKCAQVCPQNAHTFLNGIHIFDRSKCTLCGKCVEACLPGALEYYGQKISVDEAVAAILEDKIFYDNSGGGATFSGGEPLLQAEFCADTESINAIGEKLSQLSNITAIQLLAYHDFARSKYEALGKTDTMPEVIVPSTEQIHNIADKFRKFNLPV